MTSSFTILNNNMAATSDQTSFLVEKISQLKNEADKMILVSGKDHQRVEIHRVILAAMSDYFERNLGSNSDEIEVILDGVDGKFINEIVSFSYTGNIEIRQENVKELLDFATNYEFKLLHGKCVVFCVRQLGANNCIHWFAYADKKNIEGLRKEAFRMICSNFENISSSDMCELDFENFKEIIETDDNMAREETIFDRMVEWIQFDALGRSGCAFDLLQCIRLKHIPEKPLIEKVMPFCYHHSIVGFTEVECKERLQNPRQLYLFRYADNRGIFEIHEKGSTVVIRNHDSIRKRWRKAITITNDLPQKYYGIVFSMEKLFIIGGCTENGKFLKDVDMFDFQSKTCTDLPEMHVARGFFKPIVVDQFIYVFGGYNGMFLKDCERFNTKLEKWETLKSMHYGHHSCTVAAVNGYIYMADGYNQNKGCCCMIERYDPFNDEWMKVASVLNPIFEGVLIEWKGFLYAVGVDEGLKRYDCKQDIWVPPDISEDEDEISSSFQKLQQKVFDYDREQVVVKGKDFFKRLCPPNSTNVFLGDFSRNLVLHGRKPL